MFLTALFLLYNFSKMRISITFVNDLLNRRLIVCKFNYVDAKASIEVMTLFGWQVEHILLSDISDNSIPPFHCRNLKI